MLIENRLSHHYSGSHFQPNDLFTPEEIINDGFTFVGCPTFIHRFDDPLNPMIKSYVGYGSDIDPLDKNYLPMVCRTKMYAPSYIKTYDFDIGRQRGIESLLDYFNKKDIFKPMILDFMRKNEYHYVYKVLLGDSPSIWMDRFGDLDRTYFLYPVFIRGCKLPKKL